MADTKVDNQSKDLRRSLDPGRGRTLLFIGQDKESFNDYMKCFKIRPFGFMGYTSVQRVEGMYEPVDNGGGIQDMAYMSDEYKAMALQLGLYMVGISAEITAGDYDDNIGRLALWIKNFSRPVFLRIGYEFDLPDNHYSPAEYVAAYRYIADRLVSSGCSNVIFVWHSFASDDSIDISRWYPGDEYVDWCAVSYFHGIERLMRPMLSFAENKNMPLMLAETTPRGMNVTADQVFWTDWLESMFMFIERNDVRALSYIHADWESQPMWRGQGWGDTRLGHVPVWRTVWKERLCSARFGG